MRLRIGSNQIAILEILEDQGGLTTRQLVKGMSRGNRPEKKLETLGLIVDHGTDRERSWWITPAGVRELERRRRSK